MARSVPPALIRLSLARSQMTAVAGSTVSGTADRQQEKGQYNYNRSVSCHGRFLPAILAGIEPATQGALAEARRPCQPELRCS